MTELTWARQRDVIQSQVDRYFRRAIHIAPRAMASLQAGASVDTVDEGENDRLDLDGPQVFEHCVLESLIRSSPASATLLFKAGVELERLSFSGMTDLPAPLGDATLDWIFKGVEAPRRTPTARLIRTQRYLDETSILISAIEASLHGRETNEFGGRLLEAAGVEGSARIRDDDPSGWRPSDNYLRKVLRSVRTLALADPSHALLQFVLFQDETNRIRIRPFGVTELAHVDNQGPLSDGASYVYRGGVLQPIASVNRGASLDVLGEFESLLNSGRVRENDFQRFFETHPWLLMGLDFANAHPQPILHVDDGARLIPDFFLENLSSGWDAILDIKRPFDDMVVRRQNRVYFAQHVQNAIAQLRYYRDWFDSPSNRRTFAASYGVSTFRPRMVIVIGRKHHFRDDVERIRLSEGLPNSLELWTYDDLAARAKRYLQLTSPAP